MTTTSAKFPELCRRLGRPPPYVRQLQKRLSLPVTRDPEEYDAAYEQFLRTVIALRAFTVPLDDIADLLDIELKLLRLLHVDTLSTSPTWFLDACTRPESEPGRRLLLTRYDVSGMIAPNAVQTNLDFSDRPAELFTSAEMGEDIRRVLNTYAARLKNVRERVRAEFSILENALLWADRVLLPPMDWNVVASAPRRKNERA